jgi:hypothetical protein
MDDKTDQTSMAENQAQPGGSGAMPSGDMG